MTDLSGCPHDERSLVTIDSDTTFVCWCPSCGSISDNNGDHGAPPGEWRNPTGLLVPGWTCTHCHGFNGSAKEMLTTCRGCGQPKEKKP